jgi:hypothetical protein
MLTKYSLSFLFFFFLLEILLIIKEPPTLNLIDDWKFKKKKIQFIAYSSL